MENLTFGVITVVVCMLGYFYSFKQFNKQNLSLALSLLMLCGLILRLYTSLDFYLHEWDERYHALVAKNLIENPFKPMLYENPILGYDYKNWIANHVWLHKQPFPLWTMALSLKLFGINEIALRLPSILLSTLGILITYKIGEELFGKKVGFLAAFLFSIHGLIIELTAGRVATDHIDVFFMFFISLGVLFAIYFASKKHIVFNVLCGISVGVAILCKWLPALIVLPIWLILIIDSGKYHKREIAFHFIILCLVVLTVALPWQIFTHQTYPLEANWESAFNYKHITQGIEEHGQPFYFHIDRIRIIYGELIYIPLIWILYKIFRQKKWQINKIVIAVWIFIPLIVFSIAKTKMQAYTLFTAPAIFITTALFWHYLKTNLNTLKPRWFVILILVALLALPIRYSLERIKPFEKRERNPEWATKLKELNISDEKTILFNVEKPIEVMFYNNCIAYEKIPSDDEIKSLENKGYKVKILE